MRVSPIDVVVALQVLTFFAAGCLFARDQQWRLAISQILLGVVQAAIYTGKMQ